MNRTANGRFSRAWERVRSEPNLKRNVVILCVLIVLGCVSGGYILSNARAHWPWDRQFWFAATFDNAPAVSPGNGQEVRIAGVNVGEIRDASVSRDGKALLTLAIDPHYTVYDNAKLVLRPKSPLNEMYIELNPGGPPGKPLGENATLPASAAQPPVEVDEVLGHLDDNTRAALTTLLSESDAALVHAPDSLPAGLQATDRVVHNLQPVVDQLQTRKDKLAKLISCLSTIASAVGNNDTRLSELVRSMQQTLGTVGERSDALNSVLAQLPDLTNQLRAATGSVQGLSDQLDPTLDSLRKASGSLPGALSKLDSTVDRLGDTTNAAKPVVEKAGPVVNDLRPFVWDLDIALPELKSSTQRLNELTAMSLPHLVDLQAFVYNTRSAYSLKDADGGILRGMQQYSPESVTGLLGLAQKYPALFAAPGSQPGTPAPTAPPSH